MDHRVSLPGRLRKRIRPEIYARRAPAGGRRSLLPARPFTAPEGRLRAVAARRRPRRRARFLRQSIEEEGRLVRDGLLFSMPPLDRRYDRAAPLLLVNLRDAVRGGHAAPRVRLARGQPAAASKRRLRSDDWRVTIRAFRVGALRPPRVTPPDVRAGPRKRFSLARCVHIPHAARATNSDEAFRPPTKEIHNALDRVQKG
jgi:hypothetical protein